MTSASLSLHFWRETKLLGILYPAAIILGIGSAFISTHTNLKIITMEPRNVSAPPRPEPKPQPMMSAPADVSKPAIAPMPIVAPLPSGSDIWEFGFPEPTQPAVDLVAETVDGKAYVIRTIVAHSAATRFTLDVPALSLPTPKPFKMKNGMALEYAWQTPSKTPLLDYLNQKDWMRNATLMAALEPDKTTQVKSSWKDPANWSSPYLFDASACTTNVVSVVMYTSVPIVTICNRPHDHYLVEYQPKAKAWSIEPTLEKVTTPRH